jgi:hypothetical protein
MKTYSPGDAATLLVDKLLAEHDDFLEHTKVHLLQSQDYYKKHYDRKHTNGIRHLQPTKRQIGPKVLRPLSDK